VDEEGVVEARLKLLAEYTNDLRELQSVNLEEYQENKLVRKAVERTLHTAIEACLDIGHHIIAQEGFRSPEDNKDVFVVLGEEGVLSHTLASRLVDMARFRNLLVHEYTHLDNTVVYGILKRRLSDFDEFAQAIAAYRLRPGQL
jgi:uncharacterized protein YutE (UPF0331/DUF86 family)